VLPCRLPAGETAESLGLDGSELFSLKGLEGDVRPRGSLVLHVSKASGESTEIPLVLAVDTQAEIDYLRAGGMMPFILANLTGEAA
jgi:aconitate hydratase